MTLPDVTCLPTNLDTTYAGPTPQADGTSATTTSLTRGPRPRTRSSATFSVAPCPCPVAARPARTP